VRLVLRNGALPPISSGQDDFCFSQLLKSAWEELVISALVFGWNISDRLSDRPDVGDEKDEQLSRGLCLEFMRSILEPNKLLLRCA